jgi:AraC family transcriptional regulator, positive regulator of tynA and feaB
LGFIETHLAEPSLDPSSIASELGISVRHLHRLFARQGDSPADWIRQRRLENSRSDLADVRFRDRTITEIAFLWGFSDSAHFSRSFRKQFGISPRAFRAGAGRKYWRTAEREDPEMLLRTRLDLPYPKPN